MSTPSFHLETFRPWNPFRDPPESLRNPAEICRYPSPVLITATPQSSMPCDGIAEDTQGHLDKIQRHPLPARPPVEVCLNDKPQADTLSTLFEAEGSQQSAPLQQLPPTHCPRDLAQSQEIPSTMHIDPAILSDDSSTSAEHVPQSATHPDTALSDISPSPELPVVNADLSPRSRQHDAVSLAKSNRPSPRVTKRPYTRNGSTGKDPSRLPNKGLDSRKRFSFFSVRSQFLAMPVGERLQFLSWLFEGSLQRCAASTSASATTETASICRPSLDEDMAHDCAYQNSNAQSAEMQGLPFHHVSTLKTVNRYPLCGEDGGEAMDNYQHEYEIEKIETHKKGARGSVSYLVKWKGYEDAEATWEPYVSVQDTTALDNYELQLAIAAKSTHGASIAPTCSPNPMIETRKGQDWTLDETRLLFNLRVVQNLSWKEVFPQFTREFPGRTLGSIQVYWSTTAKKKLQYL